MKLQFHIKLFSNFQYFKKLISNFKANKCNNTNTKHNDKTNFSFRKKFLHTKKLYSYI